MRERVEVVSRGKRKGSARKGKSAPLRVMELFAGVGGFHVAFNAVKSPKGSPFSVTWANQWEPAQTKQHAFKVYERHFPSAVSHEHANVDIAKFTKALTHKDPAKRTSVPSHDLLCGGFPCQDYSVAKARNDSRGIHGKKGILWWHIYEILKHADSRPKYIVLENVDRLLKSPINERGRDFAIMLSSLNMLGYIVEWRVVDASKYGYPQRRKRVFIVARKPRAVKGTSFKSIPKVSKVISETGLLALAFKTSRIDSIFAGELYPKDQDDEADTLHDITLNFNKKNEISPFHSAGVAYKGRYWTARVHPRSPTTSKLLRDILQPANQVSEDFYVGENKIPRWRKVKGAKKIPKESRKSGIKYLYAEGAIAFPDSTAKPSRTIVTSEGGKTASRTKHLIKRNGQYRRLTPIELERLNGFPDDHTATIPDTRRAFLMGNALVVGCVARIGNVIARNEGWNSHIYLVNRKKSVNKKRKKRRKTRHA